MAPQLVRQLSLARILRRALGPVALVPTEAVDSRLPGRRGWETGANANHGFVLGFASQKFVGQGYVDSGEFAPTLEIEFATVPP